MENHDLAVFRQLAVDVDAVDPGLQRQARARQAVVRRVVAEAAMCEDERLAGRGDGARVARLVQEQPGECAEQRDPGGGGDLLENAHAGPAD